MNPAQPPDPATREIPQSDRSAETDDRAEPRTVTQVGPSTPPATASLPDRPAAPEPDALPARVGRYAVRRLLGRGGMGAVYLAHDPELDRPVALKVPRLSGPDAEERFLREARAAAAVAHPNLCPVHDAGRADGAPYLAMAYVPGPTLAEVIRTGGPLPSARAAAIAVGVARGMAEAHRHGVVHRDLKPANVLINRSGEPVVTDFGLARRAADLAPPSDTERLTDEVRLTATGALIGTPAYMPPEQARAELDRVGTAADVYALGAILFEMLTGRPPFRGETVYELLDKISRDPVPSPAALRPGLPSKLDAVVRKALAKDPADRFATMDEFAAALAPFAAGPRRRGLLAAAAVLALLVAAGTVIYVKTDHGTVEVRLSDPAADVRVAVDGDEITLTDGNRVTKLRAGPHALEVKGPDFEAQTKLFKVTRGEKTVVEVELKPKAKAVGPPAVTLLPHRARLAELLARGRQLIRLGQIGELGPVVAEALGIDPQSPTALAFRATYRSQTNDTIGALADVEAALKLNPETYQALVIRAYLSLKRGEFDAAIADLTAAARLDPANPVPLNNRALAYLRKGEYRQAIIDATRAAGPDPRVVSPLMTRASAHAHLGGYDMALADYTAAAGLAPTDWRVFDQRSAVYAKTGDAVREAADLEKAKQLNPMYRAEGRVPLPDPPKPPSRNTLSAEQAKDLEQALAAFERAWAVGNGEACHTAAEEACRIDATSAAARAARARIRAITRRFKEAFADADEAIRLDPNNAWAYTVRGAARVDQKDPAGGVADTTIAIRLDPNNPFAWNNRAWAYRGRGQYHQAVADATEALRARPQFDSAYDMRGTCYARLGEYAQALADYEAAARIQPANARWRMICATLRAQLGDPEGARRDRERVHEIDPNQGDEPLPAALPPAKKDPEPEPGDQSLSAADRARLAGLLARGRFLIDAGRFAELEAVAADALRIDPESPGALAIRATFRNDRSDTPGALADVEAALKLNPETYQALVVRSVLPGVSFDEAVADMTVAERLRPDSPIPLANRAAAYFHKKEFRQAIIDADRAITLGDKRTSPLLTRGAAHAYLGDYPAALADYAKAAALTPNDPRVFVQRSAVHARAGDEQKAAADWARAAELTKKELPLSDRPVIPERPKPPEPKKLSPEEAATLARALKSGQAAWNEGRYDDSLKSAEEACAIDPASAAARSLRARVWTHLGRSKEAIDEATAAIRLDPNDAHAYTNRGMARARLKDYPGAVADHTVALRIDPTNPLAWNNRGYAYLRWGRYHQALADVNESLRLRPTHVTALANRGSCYLSLGEYEKARADYEALVKLQPTTARWWYVCGVVRARTGDADGARTARETALKLDPKLAGKDELTLPPVAPPVKKDPDPPADATPDR